MDNKEKIQELKHLAFTLLNTCKSEISEEDREALIQTLASTVFNYCLKEIRLHEGKTEKDK